MKPNKVLIITYYWPPAGGGGVQRWLHFASNLQLNGVDITVLTVDSNFASYPLMDTTLIAKVSNIKTIKTKSRDPLKWYSLITKGNKKDGIPYGAIETKKSLFKKIAAWIRGNIFLPDARIGWNYYAKKAAFKALNNDIYSHVFSTGPPHSSHLIALAIKKKYPLIKWVADFRDPWAELYINESLPQSNWAKIKNNKYEQSVLNNADTILTVGHELKKLLQPKTKTPIEVIYNGYDEKQFEGLDFIHSGNKFNIMHFGLLAEMQDCSNFCAALSKLAEKFPKQKFKVTVVGKISKNNLDFFTQKSNFEFINLGYLPQQEAIKLMFTADLLLNVTPSTKNERILVSTKTMEYLRTKRPVLALCNDPAEFTYLFGDEKLLLTASTSKENEIFIHLAFIYNSYLENPLQSTNIDVSQYSRAASAIKLQNILNL